MADPALPGSEAVAERRSTGWDRAKKVLGPIAVILALGLKFAAKLKFLLVPIAKFGLPILKTGSTMLLSIWFYARSWGWRYAVGFVLLILVHECGHLLVARRFGLKVGAPVFIPFMGAFIALKDAPKNAWIEAGVGIGGPILGTVGALGCVVMFAITGNPLFQALAYTGFVLNLFNLAPVGFLDGGRIATALSPWLWIVGLVIMVGLMFVHPSFLLGLILLLSLPRIVSLFRAKSDAERRYFEVTPNQRYAMGVMYFGLIALLLLGMSWARLRPSA